MSGRVSVFVKTPGLSPVNTRLAADVGAVAAEAFFTWSVGCVQSAVDSFVGMHPGWEAVWVVAERDAVREGRWVHRPARWGAVWAGHGDLGARMQRAWDEGLASHGASILLGGDTPQLDAVDLGIAAGLAERGHMVVGPSTDGGFWLLAGSAMLPLAAWRDTRWSSPQTLAGFRAALGMDLYELATLTDVDTLDDAVHCAKVLWASTDPAQRALGRWMGEAFALDLE